MSITEFYYSGAKASWVCINLNFSFYQIPGVYILAIYLFTLISCSVDHSRSIQIFSSWFIFFLSSFSRIYKFILFNGDGRRDYLWDWLFSIFYCYYLIELKLMIGISLSLAKIPLFAMRLTLGRGFIGV